MVVVAFIMAAAVARTALLVGGVTGFVSVPIELLPSSSSSSCANTWMLFSSSSNTNSNSNNNNNNNNNNTINTNNRNQNAGKGDDTIKELNRLTSLVIDPSLVQHDPAFWDYTIVPTEQAAMRLHVLGWKSSNARKSSTNNSSSSSNITTSICDGLLLDCGAERADLDFYEQFYGVFHPNTIVTVQAPTAIAGLVLTQKTFARMLQEDVADNATIPHIRDAHPTNPPAADDDDNASFGRCFQLETFAKIIVVRGQEDEDEEEEEEEEEEEKEDYDDGDENGRDTTHPLRPRRQVVVPDIEVSSLGELRALTICSYAYLTKKT